MFAKGQIKWEKDSERFRINRIAEQHFNIKLKEYGKPKGSFNLIYFPNVTLSSWDHRMKGISPGSSSAGYRQIGSRKPSSDKANIPYGISIQSHFLLIESCERDVMLYIAFFKGV